MNHQTTIHVQDQQIHLSQDKPLSISTRIAYGSGDVACNFVFGMISTLLVLFYTDYVGISPITVGSVMLISRLFDGASDVVMGHIVSRTRSRWGQSRPWILWMAFPYAISAVLLFTVPQTSATLQFFYVFITYNFCTTICYTAINLPYGSLSSMMSRSAHERELLCIFRMAMSPIGRIIAVTGTLPLVKLFGGDQMAWVMAMTIWAALALFLLLFCFAKCKETVYIAARENQDNISMKKNLHALVRNQYFWAGLLLWALEGTSMTVTGTILPYYCKYIFLNDTWMYSTLFLVETVAVIAIVIFCPFLRRYLTKSKIILLGGVVVIASQLLFLLDPYDFEWCLFTTIMRGIGRAPISAFVFSMIGDAVEFGQWKTRIRQEGYIFSGGSVGAKIGMGLAQAIITGLMTMSGYIATAGTTVQQPQSALDSIINIYIYSPIIVWVIVLIVCCFYKLDKKYPIIMQELKERESRGQM